MGGAVRDQLLGRPVSERDWVVVGASAEQLLAQGYLQVGKDFPVFLHPQTHEEYALARTERKVQPGYHGFAVHATPDVSLEEDLKRRDLTINAIAQAEDGRLIDPYGGQEDLQQCLLRHVSPAFAEDPVRILRVARFAARFEQFEVAEQTLDLMRSMVDSGEMDATVPERVWRETQRALTEQAPARFVEVLAQVGALSVVMPELTALPKAVLRMQKIAREDALPEVRWAAWLQPLMLPQIQSLQSRLRVPGHYAQLAVLMSQFAAALLTAPEASAAELLAMLQGCDALRRVERFALILRGVAAHAATLGQDFAATQDYLQQARALMAAVDVKPLLAQGLQGAALAQAMQQARLQALQTLVDT